MSKVILWLHHSTSVPKLTHVTHTQPNTPHILATIYSFLRRSKATVVQGPSPVLALWLPHLRPWKSLVVSPRPLVSHQGIHTMGCSFLRCPNHRFWVIAGESHFWHTSNTYPLSHEVSFMWCVTLKWTSTVKSHGHSPDRSSLLNDRPHFQPPSRKHLMGMCLNAAS